MEKPELRTSYTFEIDNFSEKNDKIMSPMFLCGDCEWDVVVYPNQYDFDDHMRLYLKIHNPNSLCNGWKRITNFRFSMLNQSGKVVYRGPEQKSKLFCAEVQTWGHKTLPLGKLKEEILLEKNKLFIKVEVEVVEVVDGVEVTGKEMLEFNGFEVLYTEVFLLNKIFVKHPDFADNFRPKAKVLKTAYINLLLGLIHTLCKPPQNLSETELRNAQSELSELMEAGFQLDWLKTKLEELSLKHRNNEKVELRINYLELSIVCLKFELNELNEEKANSSAAAKFSLPESELTEAGSQLDCLKTKLDEVPLKKRNNEEVEERIKLLELALPDLETDLNKEKAAAAAKVSSFVHIL